MAGADLVQWTPTGDGGQALLDAPIDFSTLTEQTGQIAYAAGATADGFMIAGAANDAGTEGTYLFSPDTWSLSAYGKRASEQGLLVPSAVAYNGWFYVLAATQDAPYRVFSATAVETFEQPGDYVEPEEPTDPEEPEQPTDPEKPVDQKDPASPGELPSTGDPAGAYMAAVAVAGAVALGAAAVSARKRVLS